VEEKTGNARVLKDLGKKRGRGKSGRGKEDGSIGKKNKNDQGEGVCQSQGGKKERIFWGGKRDVGGGGGDLFKLGGMGRDDLYLCTFPLGEGIWVQRGKESVRGARQGH